MDDCPPQETESTPTVSWWPHTWPLYVRVLIGVILGAMIGLLMTVPGSEETRLPRELPFGWTTAHLGVIASLYIQLLSALATPLIFFAVVEAFVKTNITARQGLKMFFICLVNIAFAFLIGLVILNTFQPGEHWRDDLAKVQSNGGQASDAKFAAMREQAKNASIEPLELLKSYIPKSVFQPLVDNTVLTVAVLAILVGAAYRSLKGTADAELLPALVGFEQLIVATFHIIIKMLMWLIELAPFAICLAVADVVGKTGIKTFELVGVFFLTTTVALSIHAFLYYPLTAWLIGGKSPVRYFSEGIGAILTGFSLNSSLATAPLTLRSLEQLGVSDSSARLSACVGTNFNNDGITLYEAMTALFIAQASGMDLTIAQQITILLAALAGSMGIAGIPNSGFIILTLVLKAAKLPDDVVNFALPIVYSIDFIIARLRSAVNVMGDLQVAILLDAGEKKPAA